MSDVFISYSRKDKSFVQKLHDALRSQNQETWVDWDSIEKTEEWWSAIERGIEGTNTFVFVISPDSVTSEICRDEIDHAVKHNKRLVPLVCRDVKNVAQVHPALGKLNWLFLREQDPFEVAFAELIRAIETDLEHVRSHTRILQRAIEWEREGRNPSFVLRGDDLQRAQTWLTAAEQEEPKPTELQREYISASHASEEAATILLQAGQRAKRLVQIGSGVLALTLVGSAIAAGLAWKATGDARTATRTADEAKQQAKQEVATAKQQADAIIQQADKQVKAAEIKQKAAEAGVKQAQSLVAQAKANLSKVQAELEAQIRSAQEKLALAQQQTQGAEQKAQAAEAQRREAEQQVEVAEAQRKAAEALQAEAKAGTQIERVGALALRRFDVNQADGLWLAMQAGFELRKLIVGKSVEQYPAISPLLALQSGLEKIRETKIPSNQGIVLSVAFSPDGTRIATGGLDGSTKLWDKEGKAITTINSNQGIVLSVAFSSDGTRIATGGDDGSTKLWDKDGNQIGQFEGGSPAFSPDWQTIAIVQNPSYFGAPLPDSKPSIVNFYHVDLNLDSLLRRACQRLKPYILDDPKQRTEQSQCEQHLGENWEAERTAK